MSGLFLSRCVPAAMPRSASLPLSLTRLHLLICGFRQPSLLLLLRRCRQPCRPPFARPRLISKPSTLPSASPKFASKPCPALLVRGVRCRCSAWGSTCPAARHRCSALCSCWGCRPGWLAAPRWWCVRRRRPMAPLVQLSCSWPSYWASPKSLNPAARRR